MRRRGEKWVFGCFLVVIVLGVIFWYISPIIGILVVIIALLTIGIIYIYRTQDYDVSMEPPTSPLISNNEEARFPPLEEAREQDLAPTSEYNEAHPDTQIPSSILELQPTQDAVDRSKELQKRILELEKRVQALNERLARDPFPDFNSATPLIDEKKRMEEGPEQELSEKAIQHLLDTLDDKLAKRAISKQLYKRLRDKYIARIQKTKKGRETPLTRGTKDASKGDT
jgi:hypothetical protein